MSPNRVLSLSLRGLAVPVGGSTHPGCAPRRAAGSSPVPRQHSDGVCSQTFRAGDPWMKGRYPNVTKKTQQGGLAGMS